MGGIYQCIGYYVNKIWTLLVALYLVAPVAADPADLARFQKVITLLTERSRYHPTEFQLRESAEQALLEARSGKNIPSDLELALLQAQDRSALQKKVIESMVKSLNDPWARFYTPEESARLRQKLSGEKKAGVGLHLAPRKEDGVYRVIGVDPNSPAWGQIQPGETVLAANGTPSGDPNFAEHLRGDKGEVLTLRVSGTSGVERDVALVRADYQSQTAYVLDGQRGLIRISSFGKNTAQELRSALQELDGKPAVIDLRFNGGGYLLAAVECADLFLPAQKRVVTVVDSDGEKVHQTDEPVAFQQPVCLLVNDKTASAAEIFTAALAIHTESHVIGDKTYGKGSVQRFVGLPGNWALKYTTSLYKTPDDVFIDKIGLQPDVDIDMDPSDILGPADTQLYAAMDWIHRARLAKSPEKN
jgi:carboxyl-terminal processing protease